MKKFIITLLLIINTALSLSANTVTLSSNKDNIIKYDSAKIIEIMNKYHKKYGNTDYVNIQNVYYTVAYYANHYDMDLLYCLSFFAIESGYSYVCKSYYSAVGIGQVTEVALLDFNNWYNKKVPFSYMNDKYRYDYNIMVSLGYLRMCWDKYRIIRNGDDLMRAYNIGIGNLTNIKNGVVTKWTTVNGKKVDYWKYASDRYAIKFYECYNDFHKCIITEKK